jgi:hypothetical protein
MIMTFRELKAGYLVHSFHKETMEYKAVKVVSVGAPYIEPAKPGQLSAGMSRMVDVVVDEDGRNHIYAIPENAGVTFAGDAVLSCEPDGILREVRAVKSHSEGVVESVDTHKERIAKCEAIIADLDTAYKEKRAMDSRLSVVETCVKEVKDEIRNLIKELRG